ncbi:MAG: hypothetical protein RMJ82_11530 [Gemmatales bacterium]|nr:hypothetical protein [Gemmatales bacterium]
MLAKTSCPYCWEEFDTADVLWVAAHESLTGDELLGPDKPVRFLPSVFTLNGEAVDLKGMVCRQIACPHCHLIIPRAALEMVPLYLSILGTPASGKSYYLAALSWQLRRLLPTQFAIDFSDADPSLNITLSEYERNLFLHPYSDRYIPLADLIPKTQTAGPMYESVNYGDHSVRYSKPFLFVLRPNARHPYHKQAEEMQRLVCLYDNSGEHFRPGQDDPQAPVTWHLARSQSWIYVFDPTADPRFRSLLQQMYQRNNSQVDYALSEFPERQDTVLLEAVARVRRLTRLSATQALDKLLLVVVSKADVWFPLVSEDRLNEEPWNLVRGLAGLDSDRIVRRSALLESLLSHYSPEVVGAARSNFERVAYIAASALGQVPKPLRKPDGKVVPGVKPSEVKPWGVIVPFLLALIHTIPNSILSLRRIEKLISVPSRS